MNTLADPMSTLSRRNFLEVMALALAAGCSPGVAPPPLTGGIVGASADRGHRLREHVPPPASSFEPIDTLIVGAGVAGLSAGWRLKAAGFHQYTVLDLEDQAGGNARWGESPLTPYPWGAHYVPAPPPEATITRRLLAEMGILTGYDTRGVPKFQEMATCFAPEERLFYQGEWFPGLYLRVGASRDDLDQLERFQRHIDTLRYQVGSDGRRMFTIPMDKSSQDPDFLALDTVTFAAWLDSHHYTSPRLRWLTEYAVRDDLCATPPQISAWAGLHYFCSRLLHLDPTLDQEPPTLTWPEGNGFLIKYLLGIQADHVKTGQLVYHLDIEGDGSARVSSLDIQAGKTRGYRCRRVIFAAPSFVARRVIQSHLPSPPRLPEYAPWMVANLHVRERPRGRGVPPAWDNVLYQGAGVGYVAATHQQARYQGPAVLTYYLPLSLGSPQQERQHLYDTSWDQWVQFVLAELRPAHPDLPELLTHLDVFRWGHAMARPAPGHLWGGARQMLGQSLGPIRFAHSDLGLPLFEEAQHQGVQAAEGVLREWMGEVEGW